MSELRWLGGYRFLEHVSDAFIEAWGTSLEETFTQAAIAMYEVMLDISSVEPLMVYKAAAKGFDLHSLLYDWLEGLLVAFDTEGLVFSRFDLKIIQGDEYRLTGSLMGEEYDPKRHGSRVEVKAVTFHEMKFEERKGKTHVTFLLDI